MTDYLSDIVARCCKTYFTSVNPKKIRFRQANVKGGINKARLLKTENGITTIQIDRKFANDAEEFSLTAAVAHQLAHVKLNHKDESFKNEKAAEIEVRKFFKKWIRS